MHCGTSQQKLPLGYFLLVFALSIPLWLIGGNRLPFPVNLPVSALGFFVPATAASIVTFRRDGPNGMKELLRKALDYRKIRSRIWFAPILLLFPLIYSSSYAIMRLAGLPLPEPRVPLRKAPAFFVLYFIGAVGEELGWTAYATDPLQERWGALKAAVVLGGVWALWHAIPFVQTRNSRRWIVWQSIYTVASRILTVWIYNKTGKSVFAAILFHDMSNVSWSLFPNYGSHYDPSVTGLITSATAAIVTLGWRPKTLSGRSQA